MNGVEAAEPVGVQSEESIASGRCWRFVVCVDVEAEGLDEAYELLHAQMAGRVWESSNEAYDPRGNRVDEDELAGVRMCLIARLPI